MENLIDNHFNISSSDESDSEPDSGPDSEPDNGFEKPSKTFSKKYEVINDESDN